MTKRVVAFSADLLFTSKIEATLARAGYDVAVVEDLAALTTSLAAGPTALLILDLHAGAAVAQIVGRAGAAPVLAFGRHTEPEVLRAAREAGCAIVVARSTFVEEMAPLADRLTANRPGESETRSTGGAE